MKLYLTLAAVVVGTVSSHNFDALRHLEDDLVASQNYASNTSIPPFVIDLDAPALERFAKPTQEYREQILKLYQQYENSMRNVWGIQDQFVDMLDYSLWWGGSREKYLEMQGVAKALGIKTSRVVMVNYIFEFVTYCTSILAKQYDGTLLHLRMLDFGPPALLKNLTYVASFRKNGTELFKGVMFAGIPGSLFTAIKDSAFSISINQRMSVGNV